jgi:hypothetical protein
LQENTTIEEGARPAKPSFGRRALKVLGITLLAVVVLTAWWVKRNLYASELTPTQLNAKEQQVLEDKLALLDRSAWRSGMRRHDPGGRLKPEPYSEAGAKREIRITERELNAIIARDQETAERVAIDLSRDLVSVTMIVPVDEDFPVLGGKTLRLSFGLTLSYERGKPVVALKGISLGGVPLPNAWLGNLKGVNLVEEFSEAGGFWDLFAAGVKDLRVEEGRLLVKLNE